MGSAYAKPWTPTKVDLMKLTQEDLKVLLSRGGMRITNRPSKNDLADAILQKWETIKERVCRQDLPKRSSLRLPNSTSATSWRRGGKALFRPFVANAMRDYINDIKNSESETESTDDVSAVGAEEGGEEEDAQTDDPCVSHVSEAETDEDEEQEEEEEEEEEDEESEQDAEPDTKEKISQGGAHGCLDEHFVLDIENFHWRGLLADDLPPPLVSRMPVSLVRMVHKNKKVENFRRLTEYVKGGTSLDDCTFYLQPKLKGGAKAPHWQ